MKAGTVCNRQVVFVHQDDALIQAAVLMRDHHVGTLVVIEEEHGLRQPVGMLTDRDIVVSVIAKSAEMVEALLVKEVMTTNPVLCREEEDIDDVLERMRRHGIRRIPVVDHQGALQGIIALDDLLEYATEQMTHFVQLIGREQKMEAERRP